MEAAREHRAGFAKRPQNFGKIVATAEAYEPEPFSRDEINRAILFGMAHLAPAETKLLMVYTAFLGRDDITSGRAFVYPSGRLITALTGWGHSTLRRHRQALEHKGLIIRNLNRANRPAHTEAIDLRPLLAAVRAAQEAADAVFDAHRDYSAFIASSPVYQEEKSAHPLNSERLIQSQDYQLVTVTEEAAPTARSRSTRAAAKRPLAGSSNQSAAIKHRDSPIDRAKIRLEARRVGSTRSKSRSTITDEQARSAIAEAVQLAPDLAPYFAEVDFERASLSALIALAGEAVAGLFPDRNTHSHTWTWAVRRHSWKAVIGLAAALADPTVTNRYGFLGWISKTPGLDFSSNLARARSAAKVAEPGPAPAAPQPEAGRSSGEDAPATATPPAPWSAILTALAAILSPATVNAWIRPLAFHGIEAGTIHLEAPGAFIRDRVSQEFREDILRATNLAGFAVDHIEIITRAN